MAAPVSFLTNAYFAGFQWFEKASEEVATPLSPKLAERASGAMDKKGTAVVTTRISCCAKVSWVTNKSSMRCIGFFIIILQ